MKHAATLAVVLAIAVPSASAFSQAKPNFSGKWTQGVDPNAPAPAGRGRGMGGLGTTFTATQDDKTLTVVSTTQAGEIKTVYNLDGTETKNPITFGGNTVDRVSKVKWDGAKLVMTSTSNFQGNAAETTQIWSLDASGTLTVDVTNNYTGTPTTSKVTYKKG